MLLIRKNTTNTVILTLKEKQTLTTPVFLFRLINDIENREISFIAADTSAYTYRYNKFSIQETSGANDLLTGVVTLNPPGFWRYEVYEQSSSTNLDYLLSLNPHSPLEKGRITVKGTGQVFIKHREPNKTFKSYNPNA